MVSIASFDIFSGESKADAIWLETVEGVSNARDRMEQIAAEKPGPYFVFCVRTSQIVAQTSTFKNGESNSSSQEAAS
jgi:hypothetical protein